MAAAILIFWLTQLRTSVTAGGLSQLRLRTQQLHILVNARPEGGGAAIAFCASCVHKVLADALDGEPVVDEPCQIGPRGVPDSCQMWRSLAVSSGHSVERDNPCFQMVFLWSG